MRDRGSTENGKPRDRGNEGIEGDRTVQEKSGKNKIYENAIKNWPEDERPREKLFKAGEHTLSNTELLAILLRSGVKGQSAIDLARKILSKFKTLRNMSHTDIWGPPQLFFG